MKNYIIIVLLVFIKSMSYAQDTPKDSVKTEVVEVITSYAPKVTDAYKIKKKPNIKRSGKTERKALDYTILSVPVASKFTPKSGVLKGIDVGEKEQLFDNYFSIGGGNNITPFFEAYMHNNLAFDSEYSANLNFISSSDPVADTELSSSYYNIDLDFFFKKEARYFDWKTGFNIQRNKYNWYGLPDFIDFTPGTISAIDEEQIYKLYKIYGELDFTDSYFESVKSHVSYFSDITDSNELEADLNTKFTFPLGRFGSHLEDLKLGLSLHYLDGTFDKSYNTRTAFDYSFATVGLNPSYLLYLGDFDVKLGAKGYYAFDIENSQGNFYPYPDVEINYPIIPRFANIYVGATGGLHNNSFQSLSENNPYVSPTLTILQTDEKYNAFGGFRGILGGNITYNVRAGYKDEVNKPLYTANISKSNGIRTAENDGFTFRGYEYGNSFDVTYDDIKTIYFSGEIEYDYSKRLTLGLYTEFNQYDLSNEEHAWNLPQIKGDIFAKYKTYKWYAASNIYVVGSRKGIHYDEEDAIIPVDLGTYIDINVNGGYHVNDIFSAFLRVNNILNTNYQKFTNFNAQGFQVIGGVVWKFDSLF